MVLKHFSTLVNHENFKQTFHFIPVRQNINSSRNSIKVSLHFNNQRNKKMPSDLIIITAAIIVKEARDLDFRKKQDVSLFINILFLYQPF